MTGNLQPLDQKFPIVTPDGRPTLYFIKWAQQKQIDIGQGITAEQALAIIEQYLADHQLQEGSGISISPSGNLSDAPTIAAEVQEILDQITTTRGSILFRGVDDWQALAPGTAGQFLKTNGAGADPSWAAGGGGGSAAWNLLRKWSFAVDGALPFFDVSVAGYDDALVIVKNVTLAASQWRTLKFSSDGGATFDTTAGNYQAISSTGGIAVGGDVNLYMHASSASASRSCFAQISALNHASPTFFNTVRENNLGMHTPEVVVNAIRVGTVTDAVNFTGGDIWVFAR